MTPTTAKTLIALVTLYLAAGIVFGAWFAVRGVKRNDPDARRASWGFRLAILPGVAALWPFLVRRKPVGDDPDPRERTPHRAAAQSRSSEVAP